MGTYNDYYKKKLRTFQHNHVSTKLYYGRKIQKNDLQSRAGIKSSGIYRKDEKSLKKEGLSHTGNIHSFE